MYVVEYYTHFKELSMGEEFFFDGVCYIKTGDNSCSDKADTSYINPETAVLIKGSD